MNCKAASTPRPHLKHYVGRVASATKHYDKIAVLWHNTRVRHCNRTRTLACHVQCPRCLVLLTL